jgi:anti-sigma factor RsiW
MTCRELAGFLAAYVSGELPPDVLSRFERHMAACPNCKRYVAHYRQSILLGRAAFDDGDPAASGHVPHDLIAAILSARRLR